jgi:hypothetical protein
MFSISSAATFFGVIPSSLFATTSNIPDTSPKVKTPPTPNIKNKDARPSLEESIGHHNTILDSYKSKLLK